MAFEAPITKADEWFVGEDRVFGFNIDDEATPAVPTNMAGWSLAWSLWPRKGGGAVLFTKTVGAGIEIVNSPAPPLGNGGTNARAEVTLARADTVTLPPGSYFFTLRRTNAGFENVLAYGDAVLRPR
jgi:hypothetical protein